MIIFLPKEHEYKMGNDFPLISIPKSGENSQEGTFDDFQWWALSKDFQNWLKEHPRQWTAESVDYTKYTSITELIKERLNHTNWNALRESNKIDSGRVLPFSDFTKLNEVEAGGGQKEAQEDDVKKAVKLHFAYNSLLSQGKLDKEIKATDIAGGEDMAVFLVVEDPNTGENLGETLKAFKMKGITNGTASGSKIELLNVTEMVPGGAISEEDKPENLITKIVQTSLTAGLAGAAGVTLHSIIKWGAYGYGGRQALKALGGFRQGLSPQAVNAASQINKASGVKTLWGGVKNLGTIVKNTATLKHTRDFVTALYSGYQGFKAAGATTATALKSAFGLAKTGTRAIPIVGEILMAIQAVGGIWNWYSDNQAPRYNEVDSFAHNEMDPKKIPIGVPITICWSQPAQSTFGVVLSFIANNDTRTTCELIKIGDQDGKSVFILTQINSKSLQKQLMEHELVLLSLDNSDIVNDQGGLINTVKRVFDNEDLDFTITYFDNLAGAASVFNFQGACSWSEFMSAYGSASDQLIVANPNAPDTYQFYYKDPDGDVINVSGKLVPNEQLKNTDSDRLLAMFFPTQDKKFQSKYTEEEKEEKVEDRIEAKESEFFDPVMKLVSESGIITNFSDFGKAISHINEEGEDDEDLEGPKENPEEKSPSDEEPVDMNPPAPVKANPEEGKDDADSENQGMVSLSPKELSTPAEVMIYYVTEKAYANPELKKFALRGSKFTNFLIDEADISVKEGEKITVDVNTVGGVNPIDPRRGIFTFVPDEEDEEDIEDRKIKVQPDIDDELDIEGGEEEENKEPIVTSPKDVKIKDRDKKLVIRDRSVDDGVNIMDEFLSDEDRKILGIADWKAVSLAKAKRNKEGEIDEIVLRNKYAPLGRKTKKYRITDGEPFEVAKKFVEETDQRIKYK